MTTLAVLAAAALAYALVSRRLENSVLSAPMFFVAVGVAFGPHALDVLSIEVTHGTAFHVAELTLALLLFSDAAGVDLQAFGVTQACPAVCSESECRPRSVWEWRLAPRSSLIWSSGRRRSSRLSSRPLTPAGLGDRPPPRSRGR
jgi:hypothetical protein